MLFCIVVAIKDYANRTVFVNGSFINHFSKLSVDFRNVNLSPKPLDIFSIFLPQLQLGAATFHFAKSN